jgi:hypothetical protein
MSCPDIYIGDTRAAAPPSPFWQNPAIQPPADNLTQGVPVVINVYVRNHGTDDAPSTRLQLYYANPTTGFMPIGQIEGDWDFDGSAADRPIIPGATLIPAADGVVHHPFAWTPPGMATLPNGGHVCLLARVYNLASPPDDRCVQEIYGASPPTDKLQGIRNIHVIAPPPSPSPAPGGPGGDDRGFMAFAFAATNTLRNTDDTRLTVRALDPKNDRGRLETLVADPAIDKVLRNRRLTFGTPNAVLLTEGRERTLHTLGAPVGGKQLHCCPQRFTHLGPLSAQHVEHLRLPGTKAHEVKKPIELKLLPGEARQTIVAIEPSGRKKVAYVVEVQHESADNRAIGGLTLIFVPPHDYF